jgi:hypothetical protein
MSNPGPAGLPQLQQIVVRMINLIVPLAFVALTIMLIYGGIRYLTSGGDQNSIKSAGQTVTWAILGILFLALAFVFLQIIKAFTGVDVIKFCLSFDGTGC